MCEAEKKLTEGSAESRWERLFFAWRLLCRDKIAAEKALRALPGVKRRRASGLEEVKLMNRVRIEDELAEASALLRRSLRRLGAFEERGAVAPALENHQRRAKRRGPGRLVWIYAVIDRCGAQRMTGAGCRKMQRALSAERHADHSRAARVHLGRCAQPLEGAFGDAFQSAAGLAGRLDCSNCSSPAIHG